MHCFLETSSSAKEKSVSLFFNLPILTNFFFFELKVIFLLCSSPNKTSKVNNEVVAVFLLFFSSAFISIFTCIKKFEKLKRSPVSNNYIYKTNNLYPYII